MCRHLRITRRVRAYAAAAVVLVASVAGAAPRVALAQDGPSLPSVEQLRETYDKGDYKGLLPQAQRILALKGDAAEAYDRAAVLLLKADAHLQLRQQAPAMQAYKEAAEVATEPPDLARARAMELLLKRSQGLKYTGKGEGGVRLPPVDVVADRDTALKALLGDEMAQVAPKLDRLRAQRTLPAVVEAVELVQPLRAIELTATGKTTESDRMIDGMGGHAAQLITAAVTDMSTQAEEIEAKANTVIEVPQQRRGNSGLVTGRWKRMGIDSREGKALKGIMETCAKVVPAARELSEVFPDERAQFAAASGDAARLAARANTVLETDYSKTYRDPASVPR